MSEVLAEAKDNKKTLLVGSLDIEKAFDVISHPILLRKLYLAGLSGPWWTLKQDMYTDMTTKVKWKGELGKEYVNHQGNRQGGKGGPGDFKEYTHDHLRTLKSFNMGTNIGSIYTGVLACADDILLTAESQLEMTMQMQMMAILNNRDRMRIHPLKTNISTYGFGPKETAHLQASQPWSINGDKGPVGVEFTHLGINYNLSSYNATASTTIDTRLQRSRATTYGLMGVGLHGTNGLNVETSLHIYNTFVIPKVLHGLEAMNINPVNITRLEVGHRALIRDIQGLPKRTATPSRFILSGAMPLQAIIDKRRLGMLPSFSDNPTLLQIVHRQVAVKDLNSSSWIIATQSLLYKYKLPHIRMVCEGLFSKDTWKVEVDKAVHLHWKSQIQKEAEGKSTLSYLNKTFTPGQPHLLWLSTGANSMEVRRSTIKARMLTGCYILQHTRAAFNQTRNTQCPLCKSGDEDLPHFLVTCTSLSHIRKPMMERITEAIPKVFLDHPSRGWSPQQMTQLILDPTHPSITSKLPMQIPLLYPLEKQTRLLCFRLHKERSRRLADL